MAEESVPPETKRKDEAWEVAWFLRPQSLWEEVVGRRVQVLKELSNL